MAIYLDESQRTYLKQLLKKNPSDWWTHKKLLEQIENEEKRLEEIKNCTHKFANFKGEKNACAKCEAHAIGMGTKWEFNKYLSEKEIKALEEKITNLTKPK